MSAVRQVWKISRCLDRRQIKFLRQPFYAIACRQKFISEQDMQSKPEERSPGVFHGKFVAETTLKRDIFSETIQGHLEGDPAYRVILRKLDEVPFWAKPVAWWLARKEIRALEAVRGVQGCPVLIRVDHVGILRSWTEGTPLQLARPDDAAWYRDAKRLLRDLRRRGVAHNDLAKPQNWLRTPSGQAAIIDFQLASVRRRKSRIFQTMAREDLRHLLKQKKAYAPNDLQASEKTLLARKSLPSRIWMMTGKRLYNFVTRRLLRWSDGEGTQNRIAQSQVLVRAAIMQHRAVHDVVLCSYPLPSHGVGLYAFVEALCPPSEIQGLEMSTKPELIQVVSALPRDNHGNARLDILNLIAQNRVAEVQGFIEREPALKDVIDPILAGRLNFTDRRLRV